MYFSCSCVPDIMLCMHFEAIDVVSGSWMVFPDIESEDQGFDSAFVGSTDCSPVDLRGVRYTSVNVGASVNFGKSPGSPN